MAVPETLKREFVTNFRADITTVIQKMEELNNAYKKYFAVGFNSGGVDPITDAELAVLGVPAADIASGITLVENLEKFRNNEAVTQGDYETTFTKLRADV